MLKLRNIAFMAVLLALVGCGTDMTEDDYDMITAEFTDEIVFHILETEDLEFDSEYERFVENKLDEVARRYDYSANDYLRKAQSRGEDWDTIWERIGERIWEFLEIFWEQVEEDSLALETDKEELSY